MRDATREALFNDKEYLVLWRADTEYGVCSLVSVAGRTAIIHEYPNPDNGFEIYVQSPGNTTADARLAMGLSPDKGE